MHRQRCVGLGCVGLGKEGTDLFHWRPLLEEPALAVTARSHHTGQACHPGQLSARCSSVPQNGPHSAPRPGAGLGVCCQSALTSNHKPMVSWKEIWAPEAKEPGAQSSSATDMGSSPHLSGQWEASSYS